jgi:hypothetical protein
MAGRIHTHARAVDINWQDDNTLKLETDAGTQTRIFRFGPPQGAGEIGMDLLDFLGLPSGPSPSGIWWNQLGFETLMLLVDY